MHDLKRMSRQYLRSQAKFLATALFAINACAQAAPDEVPNPLPPTLTISNAKIVVISLTGSKVLKVTRRFEQASEADSNYGPNDSGRSFNESRTARSAEFAIALSKLKSQPNPLTGTPTPELTAIQSVDWVSAPNAKVGSDRMIELEIARTIKSNLPDATIGFVSRGKDRLAKSAEDLPSDAAVKKVAGDLRLLAEISPADRYILITPYLSQDWTGLSGAATSGTGWFVNRGVRFVDIDEPEEDLDVLDTHLASFIYVRTSVFDGKTFALLDWATTTVNRKQPAKASDGFDPWSGTSEADRNNLLKGLMADTMKRIAKRSLGMDPNIEVGEIKVVSPTPASTPTPAPTPVRPSASAPEPAK